MPELLTDLRQRHLEAFERNLNELQSDAEPTAIDAALSNGAFVRAAQMAGWFGDTLTDEGVGDLTFKQIERFARQIVELYKDAVTIDPN